VVPVLDQVLASSDDVRALLESNGFVLGDGSGREPTGFESSESLRETRVGGRAEASHAEILGWVATAVSRLLFFQRAAFLRAAQMAGATLWIVYGALIAPSPWGRQRAGVAAAAWTLMAQDWRAPDGFEPPTTLVRARCLPAELRARRAAF